MILLAPLGRTDDVVCDHALDLLHYSIPHSLLLLYISVCAFLSDTQSNCVQSSSSRFQVNHTEVLSPPRPLGSISLHFGGDQKNVLLLALATVA